MYLFARGNRVERRPLTFVLVYGGMDREGWVWRREALWREEGGRGGKGVRGWSEGVGRMRGRRGRGGPRVFWRGRAVAT